MCAAHLERHFILNAGNIEICMTLHEMSWHTFVQIDKKCERG